MAGVPLKVAGVGKAFRGKAGPLEALREVNLILAAGEFVTLVGPSGCGKTTLLNIIAGLEKATAGWVEVDGRRVEGPGADRILVFQDGALFPWLDVRGNVEFGLKQAGVPRGERRRLVKQYLKMVQLEKFARARVHELSGGMKQRVALARALVLHPRILLMDEPFAALDAQIRDEMQSIIQELWMRSGTTILFVTHNVREATCLGDRIAIMSHRPGTIKAVVANTAPRPRRIEDANVIEKVREVVQVLEEEVQWVRRQELKL